MFDARNSLGKPLLVLVRWSTKNGREVDGACGQLALKNLKSPKAQMGGAVDIEDMFQDDVGLSKRKNAASASKQNRGANASNKCHATSEGASGSCAGGSCAGGSCACGSTQCASCDGSTSQRAEQQQRSSSLLKCGNKKTLTGSLGVGIVFALLGFTVALLKVAGYLESSFALLGSFEL